MNNSAAVYSTSSRTATIERKTAETSISLTLNIDGTGNCDVACPIGFLAHMLASFCKHGLFDLSGSISGDLIVDQHHTVEDTGIVLGCLFDKALGDRAGIKRAGSSLFPMDEALIRAAVDFGGRPYLSCELNISSVPLVSGGSLFSAFQTDTVPDFWQGFVVGAKCNLHLDVLRGRSDHHKIEGAFKAAGRALSEAVERDARIIGRIPSTKGTLTS